MPSAKMEEAKRRMMARAAEWQAPLEKPLPEPTQTQPESPEVINAIFGKISASLGLGDQSPEGRALQPTTSTGNLPALSISNKQPPRWYASLMRRGEGIAQELAAIGHPEATALAAGLARLSPSERQWLSVRRTGWHWNSERQTLERGLPTAPTERMARAADKLAARCQALLAERDDARLAKTIALTIDLLASKKGDPSELEAEGWLVLLGDLPVWAAEKALVDYARTKTFRPAPAEIIEAAKRIAQPVKDLAQ